MNITKVIKYFITEINYERELSTLNEKEKKQETRTAKIKKNHNPLKET